jgi:hypothetical protein
MRTTTVGAAASFNDVLSSPAWTALAAILALAAIGTSIGLYRRGRARKQLEFSTTETPLVSVRSEAGGKIEITYDGEVVKGVHLVSFALANVGNVPVLDEDFEGPIVLALGANAVALTVEVTDVQPADLRPVVQLEESKLVLTPLLLNPGDTLSITALVRDFEGPLTVEGRVAGVERITNSSDRTSRASGVVAQIIPDKALFRRQLLTLAGLAAIVTFTIGVIEIFFPTKSHTRIVLRNGKSLCGSVLRVDSSSVVVQLEHGGRLQVVPIGDTKAMRDKAC